MAQKRHSIASQPLGGRRLSLAPEVALEEESGENSFHVIEDYSFPVQVRRNDFGNVESANVKPIPSLVGPNDLRASPLLIASTSL